MAPAKTVRADPRLHRRGHLPERRLPSAAGSRRRLGDPSRSRHLGRHHGDPRKSATWRKNSACPWRCTWLARPSPSWPIFIAPPRPKTSTCSRIIQSICPGGAISSMASTNRWSSMATRPCRKRPVFGFGQLNEGDDPRAHLDTRPGRDAGYFEPSDIWDDEWSLDHLWS